MRRLLWRLFPPPEVTATRRQIAEVLRRVSPTYPLPRELERRAVALTRDTEYVLRETRDEHRSPDQVALMMLASTVSTLLMSGRYHIYRGVLSGEGHGLVSLFTRCMSELEHRGYQPPQKTQEALQRLRGEIQKLG